MWPPSFTPNQLNSAFASIAIEDAFQQFVGDILALSRPAVRVFPTLGNDGAIDISHGHSLTSVVYEVKYTRAANPYNATRNKLRTLARNLRIHLAAMGDTPAQYMPWLIAKPRIRRYCICINWSLANEAQYQGLQSIILDCLHDIATKRNLPDLARISVRILDWSFFCRRLQATPHLLLRWFRPVLPHCLRPFTPETSISPNLRSYLRGQRLPYHSPDEYRHSEQGQDAPPGPSDLLQELATGDKAGLIVIGRGGVGKSRLCEEIARLAQDDGWSVLRVIGRLEADVLQDASAFFATADARFLLLFDYLEDHRETLADVTRLLDDWRANSISIFYIANCRPSLEISLPRMTYSAPHIARLIWQGHRTRGYSHWVTRQILNSLPSASRHDAYIMSRGIPALAVFLKYVQDRYGDDNLRLLLQDGILARWLLARVAQYDTDATMARALALLAAICPLRSTSIDRLDDLARRLFEHLVTDGWIISVSQGADSTFSFVHDVLADEFLLSYMRHREAIHEHFIRECLDAAENCDAIASVLRSFERVSADLPVMHLSWGGIILGRIHSSDHRKMWLSARTGIMMCRLLTWSEREHALVHWLAKAAPVAHDLPFQGAVGRFLSENARLRSARGLSMALGDIVTSCLATLSPHIMLISAGMTFAPAEAMAAAQRVIDDRDLSFAKKGDLLAVLVETNAPVQKWRMLAETWLRLNIQHPWSSRLLVACCRTQENAGRDIARNYLAAWLDRFGSSIGAHIVLRAALSSTGSRRSEPLVGDDRILHWLVKFHTTVCAQLVLGPWLRAYRSKARAAKQLLTMAQAWINAFAAASSCGNVLAEWLRAFGASGLAEVREPLMIWLVEHHSKSHGSYVLTPLLKAVRKGASDTVDVPLVRHYARQWLWSYGRTRDAEYLIKEYLLARGEDRDAVIRTYALPWLETHCDRLDASFMLRAVLEGGSMSDTDAIQAFTDRWLAQFAKTQEAGYVYRAAVRGGLIGRWRSQAREWIKLALSDDSGWHSTRVIDELLSAINLVSSSQFGTVGDDDSASFHVDPDCVSPALQDVSTEIEDDARSMCAVWLVIAQETNAARASEEATLRYARIGRTARRRARQLWS